MTTIELKKYIYDNHKIEYILQQIGCGHIFYHAGKDYFSASNYNGDNPSAVNVKNNEYLNVTNWTRTKEFPNGSDIITLVEYNKKMSFIAAIKYLHQLLNLSYSNKKPIKQPKKQSRVVAPFAKVQNIYGYCGVAPCVNVNDFKVLNEQILDHYYPLLHIDWFREGIMPWTRDKFGLLYSFRRHRVMIPIRHWFTGELLAFNSRTTLENYQELGIKKYLISPQNYQKNINLFGLYEHKNDIQKAGYVVVYESEKSVLKRDSMNDNTGVALSGHTISDEQVRILLGLSVDIIISLDSDISLQEIRFICEKFYNKGRNIYYTFDTEHLLSPKSSIADESNDIFQYMINHKIKYNEQEHQKHKKEWSR